MSFHESIFFQISKILVHIEAASVHYEAAVQLNSSWDNFRNLKISVTLKKKK